MDCSKAIYLFGVLAHPQTPAALAELCPPIPLRCIPFDEFGALVQDVPLQEFGEDALREHMKNPQWLESQVWHHARVLESAMQLGTVLPMKFLTIFKTEERLRESLLDMCFSLHELLAKLAAREEWGMKVFCDLTVIEKAVETQNSGIQLLKVQIAGKPSGTAYLMRKQYEELVRQESSLRLTVHLESISSRLSSVAEETKLIPPPQDSSSRPMVLNASLLVQKLSFGNLLNEVEVLRQEYRARGFQFELVGPFPPYSFSALPVCPSHSEVSSPVSVLNA